MRRAWLLLTLVGCTGEEPKESLVSFEGPTLSHTPPTGALAGADLTLSVTADDPDGVRSVSVFWRTEGLDYTEWALSPGEGDTWTAVLPGSGVRAPVVDYYFKAADGGGPPASSYLPEDPNTPYSLPVGVEGLPLPYSTSFESVRSLVELDWHAGSAAARGAGWEVTPASASEGEQGVWHPRGSADLGLLQDYLISPALDFGSLSQIQVTWQERGATVENANHQLYISVGDSDPTDGGYELVSALPAPSTEGWARSAVYDLSAWAGQSPVYLAWYFEGTNSDDWYIDQVAVEELKADIELGSSVPAEQHDPGDTLTLSVLLNNRTSVEATDLNVALSFPEGGAAGASQTIASLLGNQSTTSDFSITLDASIETNRYLPFRVDVSGDEGTWTYEGQLLVGKASTATVEWSGVLGGALNMSLGVGDPDAPDWETELYSGDAALPLSLSLDITGQADYLPPSAQNGRWFLRVDADGAGYVDSFAIDHAGTVYSSGSVDVFLREAVIQLPEPPNFVLSSSTTDPYTLSPGLTGVALSLNLRNDGEATQGPVYGELLSNDPDLTVQTVGPVALSSGIVSASSSISAPSAFTFDIAATHTDSQPVNAELYLSDGVDQWVLPVSLDVPWPVLKVTDIEINDSGGDGILDAGESATITLDITNVGDLACSGSVKGILSLESSSTANVTVDPDDQSFGIIGVNSTQDARFDVVVDAGAQPGQTVDLLLSLTDSARSYEARTQLVVGEPPWRSLYSIEDDADDAHNNWDFDIVSGQWRVYNGQLQLRLRSAEPFDPATLFVEAWGSSTASSYTWYQIVIQSNIASLRGYDGDFTDLGSPAFSYPDSQTVELDVNLADMGLVIDQFSLGFGSGWCGDPDYCDQYPDAWGYPYTGWYTSVWFDLSW